MVNKMWREINKAGKMGAGGGAKYLGPGVVRGAQNLGKMSCHGCNCQEGWGPVMCNHLLILAGA